MFSSILFSVLSVLLNQSLPQSVQLRDEFAGGEDGLPLVFLAQGVGKGRILRRSQRGTETLAGEERVVRPGQKVLIIVAVAFVLDTIPVQNLAFLPVVPASAKFRAFADVLAQLPLHGGVFRLERLQQTFHRRALHAVERESVRREIRQRVGGIRALGGYFHDILRSPDKSYS